MHTSGSIQQTTHFTLSHMSVCKKLENQDLWSGQLILQWVFKNIKYASEVVQRQCSKLGNCIPLRSVQYDYRWFTLTVVLLRGWILERSVALSKESEDQAEPAPPLQMRYLSLTETKTNVVRWNIFTNVSQSPSLWVMMFNWHMLHSMCVQLVENLLEEGAVH